MGITSRKTKTGKPAAESAAGVALASVLPQDDRPWYRVRHLVLLNLLIIIPSLTSTTMGFDGALMNGLQAAEQWRSYFNQPDASILGITNAIYPIGCIMGMLPATRIVDKFGRKPSMWLGLVIVTIGAGIQGGSIHVAMFILARWVIGFGTAFISQPAPILVTELAHPAHRGKMTALFFTFYYIGSIFASWSVFGTIKLASSWSWRIPSLLQGAFPVIQMVLFVLVPESPRWLVANDRKEEAREILIRWHAGGDRESALVAYELEQIDEALQMEKEATAETTWMTMIKTGPNRRRTMIAAIVGFFAQWNGVGVVSYYITLVLDTVGITDSNDQALINGLLQVFNWLAALLAGVLMVDRLGRRTLFLISTAGMFFAYIIWTALTGVLTSNMATTASAAASSSADVVQSASQQQLGKAVVAFIFIYFFFYDIAWTPLLIAYPVEIFPYTLRARGISVALSFSNFGLIIGQFVNPVALQAIGWKYYIVFCCLLAGLFVTMYFLCPETKGRTLEEIAEVFEGPSSGWTITRSGAKVLDGEKEDVTQVETVDVERK